MERLTVQIASVPDREELVAEIWSGDDMIAELRRANDEQFLLEIYCKEHSNPWVLDLDSWLGALELAKGKLLR